jgi:type IV pilus assembly protein PilQ
VNVKPVTEKPGEKKKDEFGYSGEKLSLNFQNIDVRAALQVIADFTNLNFVTSDTVKGNLTLRLKDVPWDQALEIIADAKNLAIRKSGNVVRVGPADEVAAKEKSALEAQKVNLDMEPLASELIQINYAKAEDLAKLLKSIRAVDPSGGGGAPFSTVSLQKVETESNTLLSPRGNVTVDKRTNTLLIQDIPSKIKEVRKLIAQLDQPVRQVLIETRLVEATDDFAKNIGVRWGGIKWLDYTRTDTQPIGCGTHGCIIDALNNVDIKLNDYLNVNLGAGAIRGVNPGAITMGLLRLSDTAMLTLELQALEAEGKGKVISSPRLITGNSKKARIEQGQEGLFTIPGGVGVTYVIRKAVLARYHGYIDYQGCVCRLDQWPD